MTRSNSASKQCSTKLVFPQLRYSRSCYAKFQYSFTSRSQPRIAGKTYCHNSGEEWRFVHLQGRSQANTEEYKPAKLTLTDQCNPLRIERTKSHSSNLSTRHPFPFMKSMKRVFKRLSLYNLRSRKKTVPAVKGSMPKVNREVQASLSEENCTLLCELTYYPGLLKASMSAVDLGEEIKSSQPSKPQKYSSLFRSKSSRPHQSRSHRYQY